MPDSNNIIEVAQSIVNELDHYGNSAPFIAYLKTLSNREAIHIFITRETILAAKQSSNQNSIIYARYRLPLGRIAESQPGRDARVTVRSNHGEIYETVYHIQARNRFKVRLQDRIIDAVDNEIAFPENNFYLPALRAWINCTQDEIAMEAVKPGRRRMADRLQLPDTAIVDTHQGDVWRTNIRRFIVITGAPGTGKTTTAIKRIAQKTDSSSLEGEVGDIPEEKLRRWLTGRQAWVLFTPSELLRNYLHQALGEERLPSTEANVPMWQDTRKRIGRDVLRLFGQGRPFTLVPDLGLVAHRDSDSLASWTINFEKHFASRVHTELRRLVLGKRHFLGGAKETAAQRLSTLAEEINPWQQQRQAVEMDFSTATSDQERDAARRMLSTIEFSLGPIVEQSSALDAAVATWDELEKLARLDDLSLSLTVRALITLRVKLEKVKNRINKTSISDSTDVIIQSFIDPAFEVINSFSDAAPDSIDLVLMKLPIVYQEYRLSASNNTEFYHATANSEVNNRRLEPLEIDSIIYVALKLMREVFITELPQPQSASVTGRLAGEFRYIVAVDEATDFSAVELACMRMLAHPVFDCVTFAGDPMQRMTTEGIHDWKDIESLVDKPEIHELRYSYRQTKRLLSIAAELYQKAVGQTALFEAGFRSGNDDPEALRYKAYSPKEEADWLIQRIGEIYKVCGERLPSIALLTTDEKDIRALADLVRIPLLEQFGIDVEECPQGRILGNQAKVRLFSVQYIKGLEFESVFFVGIDRMASANPDLVGRFLYVGLTRARSFLGVTHSGNFPNELSHVAAHFAPGTWQQLIPVVP
jgi:hypothetical protein